MDSPTVKSRFIDDCESEHEKHLARRMLPTQLWSVQDPIVLDICSNIVGTQDELKHELTEYEERAVNIREEGTVDALRFAFLEAMPASQIEELFKPFKLLCDAASGPDSRVEVESLEDRRRWLRIFSYSRAIFCTGRRKQEMLNKYAPMHPTN